MPIAGAYPIAPACEGSFETKPCAPKGWPPLTEPSCSLGPLTNHMAPGIQEWDRPGRVSLLSGRCKMGVKERYKERYERQDTPWDIGRPDFNLIQTVTARPIEPCKALDIGCGTGDNSIWLAQQKFEVTGVDASEMAIQKARQKALEADVKCNFIVADFLTTRIEGAPFGFVFDRGFFHSLDSDEERRRFAENVRAHLGKECLWLSIIGNADEKRLGPGPPQRTAREIVNCVEPYFEILSLVSGQFGSNRPTPPRAWVCLMRKRQVD